jgi:hypothetical protein
MNQLRNEPVTTSALNLPQASERVRLGLAGHLRCLVRTHNVSRSLREGALTDNTDDLGQYGIDRYGSLRVAACQKAALSSERLS